MRLNELGKYRMARSDGCGGAIATTNSPIGRSPKSKVSVRSRHHARRTGRDRRTFQWEPIGVLHDAGDRTDCLERPDVARRPDRPVDATLVDAVDRRGDADGVVTGVDGDARRSEAHGLCRPAVVRKWLKIEFRQRDRGGIAAGAIGIEVEAVSIVPSQVRPAAPFADAVAEVERPFVPECNAATPVNVLFTTSIVAPVRFSIAARPLSTNVELLTTASPQLEIPPVNGVL